MKKAVSLLASFALAFSLLGAPVMGFADEGTNQTDATGSSKAAKGLVEVTLTTKLVDLSRTDGLTVALQPETKGLPAVDPVEFEPKQGNELSGNVYVARIADVEPGAYTLTVEGKKTDDVKAKGFIDYKQYGVTVKAGKRAAIELVDQYSDTLCGCKEHEANPILADICDNRGLIPYGNLDGLGNRIDNGDAKVLLQVIANVRAREDKTATAEENAKYGLNLVRETTITQPTVTEPPASSSEPETPMDVLPAIQSDDVAIAAEEVVEGSAEEDDVDLVTEVKLASGAGAESAAGETPGQPEFRIENATEDVLASAEEAAAAALEETEEGSEAGVPDGTISRYNATAPIALGLNAFQQLATMMGAQAIAGKEQHPLDPASLNMQASWNDQTTNLVIDSGKELAEVLFTDDGETVKMRPNDGEAISVANPVELSIDAQGEEMDTINIAIPSDSPNAPTAGEVVVETGDGEEFVLPFAVATTQGQNEATVNLYAASSYAAASDSARLAFFDDGSTAKKQPTATPNKTGDLIVVDLGSQIPVKIITIKVTATSSKKLAEIAHVEFLNKMEDKIGEADLNIPKVKTFKVTAGNKTIGLEWAQERNVTGYEVEISLKGSAMVIGTVKNSVSIANFNGKELVNYTTYTLRVRSVNGDWRSPWSATVTATPEATGKPMAPAAPTVKGQYNSIVVNWKQAVDAEWYKVYYKKHTDSTYQYYEVEKGVMRHVIENLELSTTYDVRVSGLNAYGEGPKSPEVSATTTPDKVKVPWYKLINREAMNKTIGSSYANNIEKVEIDYSAGGNPNDMVDGNYDTYVSGKKGGYYHGGTVTFKNPYDLDTIMLTGYQAQSLNIYDMIVEAWDANGKAIKPSGGKIKISVTNYSSKTRTVMIRTEKLTGVKKIHVAYQRSVGNAWSASTIAELAFYDTTLYSDTMALWADAEHTVLRDDVTMQTIQSFIKEATTPDPDCNEYHPSQSLILAELANAEAVCNNQALRAPMKVDPKLNVNGSQAKRGVGGLNGWQPTGVAVEAGDEIAVYVGKKGETSRAVPLAFYVVQNHPELSNGFVTRLMPADGSGVKVGMNTFLVPEGLTSINMERGGNLYVVYDTAANSSDQYTVRVSGGSYVPVLDVHNLSGDARTDAIKAYVKEVSKYDPQAEHNKRVAEGRHDTHVLNSPNYDAQNCIANATDIVMNDMMYSIPVSAVKSALGLTSANADLDAAAQKLTSSITAMEDMMKLFYQHKGFVKNASDAAKAGYGSNNAWPTLHQNIRYVRCSGKVFMYAAGNHIGIQWGSTTGVVSSPGVTLNDKGLYESGKYFGWGVAHEIGHEVNQGCYTYAEVTNNYYAQLAQATDRLSNFKTRWGSYDTVYKRVASGAKGAAGGKTGIAMYWQLHLAYDDGYNYKTYDNAADQYSNLIFARIDAYARNTASAPQAANEKAHALTLKGANKDNALMRLACAATQKNLLDFFEAWGLTPDDETKAYAAQWPEETRAIQYQTDALRLYRLDDFSQGDIFGLRSKQAEGAAKKASVTAALEYTPSSDGRANTTQDQTIKVKLTGASTGSDILGYEVLRNGTVIGFLRANQFEDCPSAFTNDAATFSDTINTVNNRVFKYEVRAVDKLLGRGDLIPAGEVKVSHKNSLSKAKWTATTNMGSGDAMPNETHSVVGTVANESIVYDIADCDEDDPIDAMDAEEKTVDNLVASAIDGNASTVFSGTVPAASGQSDARITIDFGEIVSVVGMRVQGASVGGPYVIETSSDGETWTRINTGTIAGDDAIYFTRDTDEYLYGHDAAYLRLTVLGQSSFAVSEIDVLGPQGDDAEFLTNGIGILQNDEELGITESNAKASIPAGSLVFVGTYKGNPAYNALLLYDQNGDILGGKSENGEIHAKEVIFAPPVADDAKLGDVKEGYWVYYIEPKYLADDWRNRITSVKAELYRVDNAHTLEGQRLVADTLSVSIPDDLNNIDLSFGKISTQDEQQASAETSALQPEERSALDAMGAPLEIARSAEGIGGYAYDFAEAYRPDSMTAGGDLGTMGTPLYETPNMSFDDVIMGSRISGDGTGPDGALILDDATPLASPHHEANRLAKATVRSLAETFVVVLEDANVVNIAKSLG